MRAAWWWIDRWRKSTAYTDMTLAEQGAYRNLLDELWLRDGALPMNERILAKVSGDPFEWKKVRDTVLARFIVTDGCYRNETHDAIMARSQYQAERQKRYRQRRGNVTNNVAVSPSPSPSPSPSKDQSPKKRTDSSADADQRATVRSIFDLWVSLFSKNGSTKLTTQRRGKIRARLKDSTQDEIEGALRGFASDPWRHEKPTHNELGTLLRNREQVEAGLGASEPPSEPPVEDEQDGEDIMDRLRREKRERMAQ